MPPRISGQPESAITRYRERLNSEMTDHGETDRSLAAKLSKQGFAVPYSSINKTRNGTRQPTLDECYAVARAFGYADLEEFLEGPASIRISKAVGRLQYACSVLGIQLRNEVNEAIHDLHYAVNDPAAAEAAERRNPGWRDEYWDGLSFDLRYIWRDQVALWEETFKRLEEVFDGRHEVPSKGVASREELNWAAAAEMLDADYYDRQATRERSRGEQDKADFTQKMGDRIRKGIADAQA